MRSEGMHWSDENIADLCELAGIWSKWLNAITNQDKRKVALKAAAILGVNVG